MLRYNERGTMMYLEVKMQKQVANKVVRCSITTSKMQDI